MALSEMACLAPTSGSYIRFTSMFADKALGFATGISLVYGCAITIPSESHLKRSSQPCPDDPDACAIQPKSSRASY